MSQIQPTYIYLNFLSTFKEKKNKTSGIKYLFSKSQQLKYHFNMKLVLNILLFVSNLQSPHPHKDLKNKRRKLLFKTSFFIMACYPKESYVSRIA